METNNHSQRNSEYLRQADAARYLGISESTLAKLRMRSNRHAGPRYSKVSGCVIYRKADLDGWLEDNLVGATEAKIQ